MAGLVATARGVELGLKVLVLEESVRTAAASTTPGGTISGAGFKIQQENGVEDTPEAFYADIEALGGEGEFNKPLAKMHTERAKDAIDWLDEDLKVDFGDRSLVGGAYTAMQTLRVTRALGSYAMGAANAYLEPLNARLEQAIADGNAQIMYNTAVTELLVEGDKCVGVKAGDREFRANNVVLATGGYSFNEDLLKLTGFENVISCAPSTSNGSGFLMAKAVGGVFDNMDEIVNFYGGGVPTGWLCHEVSDQQQVSGHDLCEHRWRPRGRGRVCDQRHVVWSEGKQAVRRDLRQHGGCGAGFPEVSDDE